MQIPEAVQRIRKANESSPDMVLSKPAAKYVPNLPKPSGHRPPPGQVEYNHDYGQAVPVQQLPRAPGAIPERVLDPTLHQKGVQAFRQRRWFQEDTGATISPRVRVGTANKPAGFGLPDYSYLPPNSPVTRPSARRHREALLYPEGRKHNAESADMFQGLPDPRQTLQQSSQYDNSYRQEQNNQTVTGLKFGGLSRDRMELYEPSAPQSNIYEPRES